jgi:F0F1-type ATP synthase membrane subunit c/vacuolar-type H+-ATPase subunit K
MKAGKTLFGMIEELFLYGLVAGILLEHYVLAALW